MGLRCIPVTHDANKVWQVAFKNKFTIFFEAFCHTFKSWDVLSIETGSNIIPIYQLNNSYYENYSFFDRILLRFLYDELR